MNVKSLIYLSTASIGWFVMGVFIVNGVFPGYSCSPPNNNHIYFMAVWVTIPILAIKYLIDQKYGGKAGIVK